MKQRLFILYIFFISGLFVQNSWAQTPVKPVQASVKAQQNPAKHATLPAKRYSVPKRTLDTVKNTDPSLRGQYQFMLSRSKTVNGYKLINPARLGSVWQSVTDTLKKERIELNKAKSKIADQQKTISNLQTEVSGKESSLSDSNAKLNEINFLGISFAKVTYNIIVWSIIVVLAISLAVIIARSAKNILEAKHRTQLYDEIAAEYQAYKTKSNEQQRKLARELQDERNIIEELKGHK